MAKLKDTNVGKSNYIKSEELFQTGVTFDITDARVRRSGFLDQTGQIQNQIVFILNVHYEEGDEERTLTLTHNDVRQSFVEWFDEGGEPFENLVLVQAETSTKGNPAWIFVDAEDLEIE